MNKVHHFFLSFAAVAFLVFWSGCATTHQTEETLTSAGFKAVPATTPQQQAHLKTLPAGKVSKTQKDGKSYYVFPDQAHNVLYVGQQENYDRYQAICRQRAGTDQPVTPAQELLDNWSLWGQW